MSSAAPRARHVDRDDFDADHYADFIRDTHRSRLTLEQLDIARRQLRKKERLLSRVHQLKMKEHIRAKNEFIRKVEQDVRISKLPAVKETLRAQQRPRTQLTPPPVTNGSMEDVAKLGPHEEKPINPARQPKALIHAPSPRAERVKGNLSKFNHQRPSLG